ncbi:hypothetical protein DPMN_083259 [Dreissena polymorpha]|uniref:U3 small nucleolar RNA-associated protein 10 N-terminal domain-containing protein n=1 Tax=Dreissena polymorpha TaxID=45954 RepID=A0A9D4BHJ1_DREPO|nr:hypothetical protein DPMN_083259 [Dreissena polymorpha]
MLVPHLSRGMQSRIQEFKAASYMILAQLLFKAKLKSSLLKTLQQVIAKVSRSVEISVRGQALSKIL